MKTTCMTAVFGAQVSVHDTKRNLYRKYCKIKDRYIIAYMPVNDLRRKKKKGKTSGNFIELQQNLDINYPPKKKKF